MGRKSHNLYVVGKVAFVPHPLAASIWIKTDLSVVKVACSYCKSPVGTPCAFSGASADGGYRGSTHWMRRRDARGKDVLAAAELHLIIDRRKS